MSDLSDSIKDLYRDMSEAEATHAANSLVSFFKILESIDARLAHEKSNELKNENLGSTN